MSVKINNLTQGGYRLTWIYLLKILQLWMSSHLNFITKLVSNQNRCFIFQFDLVLLIVMMDITWIMSKIIEEGWGIIRSQRLHFYHCLNILLSSLFKQFCYSRKDMIVISCIFKLTVIITFQIGLDMLQKVFTSFVALIFGMLLDDIRCHVLKEII